MQAEPKLPIDAILPQVVASLRAHSNLVLQAAPGAGKTTRVPPALLDIVQGEIVVLEPRRIAARLSARRVADELGGEVGGLVGYQVRFEDVSSAKTRIRFVTEGVLTRRLLADPMLRNVDAVVLDEFHERHLDSDLALALLKRLQKTRPELRIVVMSATIDTAPVAAFLNDCPVLRSEGRVYPLDVRHQPYSSAPLEAQVGVALSTLVAEGHTGHTLIFLPGVAEIRRAMRECEGIAQRADLLRLPLYGDLSPIEQDRAMAPSKQRKVIFATNVAESSITVDGVTAVIDSGLARTASVSQWTGVPTLEIARISKASAKQRAGRAGRTGPGVVLRLYPEADYALRSEQDEPEIVRSDLSQLCLDLRAAEMSVSDIDWLEPPPAQALERAETLLDALNAVGKAASAMAKLPLSPRLSRMVLEGNRRGVGEEACKVAALLSSGVRKSTPDLLTALQAPIDGRAQQIFQQLRRIVRPSSHMVYQEDALLLSVLSGFPDRVAQRRSENQVMLSTGISAELPEGAHTLEFFVALDLEDRTEKNLPLVRMTAPIEPEWLIDLFPDRVHEIETLVWNRDGERVELESALRYESLVLQEARSAPVNSTKATGMLVTKAMEAGLGRFVDGDELFELQARIDFAGLGAPEAADVLGELAQGLYGFTALRVAAQNFLALFESKVERGALERKAPAYVRLQSGRQTKIHYEKGKPPWIASRLQDFFGMEQTPKIGPEATPLVVHLLAPNKRAVQTTTDLKGFWERLYPTVRKELMRRYPRHAWPEKPL